MEAVSLPIKALFNPMDWVPRFVERRRWVVPVVVLAVTSASAGYSFASRWNAGPATIRALEAKGELASLSEQDLSDKVRTTQRVAIVAGVSKGLVLLPLSVLGLAVALKVLAWLFHRHAPFGKCFSTASITFFPVALFYAIYSVCALRAPGLSETDALTIVPSNLSFLAAQAPRASRILSAIDFFNLWSIGILTLGFSAATGMSRWKSLSIALLLFAAYVGVFLVGIPGAFGGPR